jgi:long-chain acyl-CoA synthetase
MIEWWGQIINEYYGGTETNAAVFHTSEEALRKPGTVGKPIDGATVKIFDSHGRELGPNEVGEVYLGIAGYPDFTYHGQPDKRREVERAGLITCGYVGYLDRDGYVFLCDRLRDMVISGGVNIYPAEIEAALITIPGVRDCAVFGVPDEEFGEALCAHVQPELGAQLLREQVIEFLRGRLAAYKVPKLIEFSGAKPPRGVQHEIDVNYGRSAIDLDIGHRRGTQVSMVPTKLYGDCRTSWTMASSAIGFSPCMPSAS